MFDTQAPAQVSGPPLDPAQRRVVDHPGGPLLVLAGPGTGKTHTLVEAVISKTDPDRAALRPDQVLILTFSRKAASELRDRIGRRLPLSGVAPLATTFHSFCYALVRRFQDPELFTEPIRLLSGPEQDVFVRDLVSGSIDVGIGGGALGERIQWPQDLRAALATRGFAEELRTVLARARELGLDPTELAQAARRADRGDWYAASAFFEEYLDVLDVQGVLDYGELVHRAVLLAGQEDVRRELRHDFRAVFVDEYQDTDPSQVRLLQALAGDGADLVVFGDPDQSIYQFRGADVRGILDFPEAFRRMDGSPADTAVLRTSRRCGPALLKASRDLTRRMPIPLLPTEKVREHRDLAAEGPVADGEPIEGSVQVFTFPTPNTELDNIVDMVRRAHLEDGVPWDEIAVLVRSATRSIPALRRALIAAGVPVDTSGDELPLAAEPAVAVLLQALRVADNEAALTPDVARALLSGPLGGMDAFELRKLARALRAEERAANQNGVRGVPAEHSAVVPELARITEPSVNGVRPSEVLLREALAEPARLVAMDEDVAEPARRLGMLLLRTRQILRGGGSVERALWELWSGGGDERDRNRAHRWPERLERTAQRGGNTGRAADRDLDAVCVLFDYAARAEDRATGRGVRNFIADLEAQELAGDSMAAQSSRGGAVRLMSAHKSKGLQWRFVIVAGVQDGLWPDLRLRGSLLQADLIGRNGLRSMEEIPTASTLLAEERRLFYVAATRARERLVVTAVDSALIGDDAAAEAPSRFVYELGVEVQPLPGLRKRALAIPALVADLRRVLTDPKSSDQLRQAAAERLARLADAQAGDGRPLVPSAHPDKWWGLVEETASEQPVRDPAKPLLLSASQVAAIDECSLRWFLDHEAAAHEQKTVALGFGNVVHVLADEVAKGDTPARLDVLMERLDRVWDRLSFEAQWQSPQQKEEARAALERFLAWHVTDRGRLLHSSEQEFDVRLNVGAGDSEDGEGFDLRIRGSFDRVETDEAGLVYVVDFKTGKNVPTKNEAQEHPQLAVYQLVVREGAIQGVSNESGGAELVFLREGDAAGLPKTAEQDPSLELPGETPIEKKLATMAARVLDENFAAYGEKQCGTCVFRKCCPKQPEGKQLL
ncbi:ATP-dependent helicase [Catenulispora acidiphila]|uniref:ATP-dependent helicase n=1 Tax=Catenulispora acidiphila TaxID=304895 RepID=UPI0001A2E63D|nr:ATP-dependent DNA helicase [Catenulispora acidiphila]